MKKKSSLCVTKATHTPDRLFERLHTTSILRENATKKYKRACYFGIISYSSTQKMFIKEKKGEKLGVL